jgi:hypothetical protein
MQQGSPTRLLGSTATDVLGRRAGRPPFVLGDAGPRAVPVGPIVHAESARRFCRLRAMHQHEFLADEPRSVFWTVLRRASHTGSRYADRQGRCRQGRRRG